MSRHPRKLAILRPRTSDCLTLTAETTIQARVRMDLSCHNSFNPRRRSSRLRDAKPAQEFPMDLECLPGLHCPGTPFLKPAEPPQSLKRNFAGLPRR